MINIKLEISKIKRRLVFTKFFDCFLNSLLIGSSIAGLLLIFGLKFEYSFIAGGAYLVFGLVKAAKRSSLKEIEKKIPDLEWQLRTASDNVGKRNEVIENLNAQVTEKIGFVNFYDLLSGKKTSFRVLGIVFVGVLIFYAYSSGFNVVSTLIPEEGPGFLGGVTGLLFEGSSGGESEKTGANGDVYGDESDIEIGRRKLELELRGLEDEIDLEDEQDPEYGKKSGRKFNGKVSGEQDSSYNEEIGIDEEELVKKYMNEIY
jgi:hypothetical protein